jgi:hypothetical protein
MGGSFESGAGDDPNDLFASDEEEESEEAEEGRSVQAQEVESESVKSTESDSNGSTGEVAQAIGRARQSRPRIQTLGSC